MRRCLGRTKGHIACQLKVGSMQIKPYINFTSYSIYQYMYISIYVYQYICISVYMYISLCLSVYMYSVYQYICISVYTCMYIKQYIYVYIYILYTKLYLGLLGLTLFRSECGSVCIKRPWIKDFLKHIKGKISKQLAIQSKLSIYKYTTY